VFERAISQASSTLPSHRAFFQSRLPSRAGKGSAALAEVLARAGFRTAAFTGGGNVSRAFGFGRGFEEYHEDPRGLSRSFDEVEIWLRKHARERFLLFVHTYDIHLPYDPPPPYDAIFGRGYESGIDGSRTREVLGKLRKRKQYANFDGQIELSEDDKRRIIALYDGGILFTDQFVGRLSLLLRELGIEDSTVLVLFSDHGEEFWDHGSALHSHTLYQELLHVPLIVSVPGGWRSGTRIDETVRLMDVAPTLLEMLQVETPKSFEGQSLLGLMSGETSEHLPAMSEILDQKSWIRHPWKLMIQGVYPNVERKLYDLDSDPGERTDVRMDHPDTVAQLEAAMNLSALTRKSSFVREIEPEDAGPELLRQLEALGYLDE
jgi:arylsulfatase A-like enzyme